MVTNHLDGVTITFPAVAWRDVMRDPGRVLGIAFITLLYAFLIARAVQSSLQSGRISLIQFDGALLGWPAAIVLSLVLAHEIARRPELSVRGGILTVRTRLLLWTRTRSWHQEDLVHVRAVSELVDSDMGKEWHQSLEIQSMGLQKSHPRRLLYWLDKAELEWIATTLRQALRLPSDEAKKKPSDADLHDDRLTFDIPQSAFHGPG